jgi:hypothetical protein
VSYDSQKLKLYLELYPEVNIGDKNYKVLQRFIIRRHSHKDCLLLLSGKIYFQFNYKNVFLASNEPIVEPADKILLCLACSKSNMDAEVIQKLLERCINIDPACAIHSAVTNFSATALKLLLKDRRTKLTNDLINSIKSNQQYWRLFENCLKEAHPIVRSSVKIT